MNPHDEIYEAAYYAAVDRARTVLATLGDLEAAAAGDDIVAEAARHILGERAAAREARCEATGGSLWACEGWDESTGTTERQRLMLEGTPFEPRVEW